MQTHQDMIDMKVRRPEMLATQEVIDIEATANRFSELFDRQKEYFNADITKSYEWRID